MTVEDPSLVSYVKLYFHRRENAPVIPRFVSVLPVSTVKIGAKSTEDIVSALEQMKISQMYQNAGLLSALDSVNRSVDEFKSQYEQISTNLDQTLYDFFNEGYFSGSVSNGMDDFKQKLEKEANDKLASALAKISEAMPVDLVGLQSSFDQLLNSVSTHDTSASLVLPAASVTLMGKDLHFWDQQTISFDDYFNLPSMQLLLLPLRFLFVFGMAKYLMYYFKKLEKLITLHTD